MNLRWLWFDYVPRDLGLTKDQRRIVSKRARLRALSSLSGRVGLAITFVIAGGGAYVASVYGLQPRVSGPASLILGASLAMLAAYVAGQFFFWIFARPQALRIAREIGVNVCPNCGYDLQGQEKESAMCSECGWSSARHSEQETTS